MSELREGGTVLVIEEERPARMFYAKLTLLFERTDYKDGQTYRMAHLKASNDWKLNVLRSDLRLDTPARPYIVLPRRIIDQAADFGAANMDHVYMEGYLRRVRPNNINADAVGEDVRVYVKVRTRSDRYQYAQRRKDYVLQEFGNLAVSLQPKWGIGAIQVPTGLLRRDVNGHIRVYVKEEDFPGILLPPPQRKDHMTPKFILVTIDSHGGARERKIAMEAFKLTEVELAQMTNPEHDGIRLKVTPAQFGMWVALHCATSDASMFGINVHQAKIEIVSAEMVIDTSER